MTQITHILDITRDICPMTFVKARRLIDTMVSGDIATLRVAAGEPLENLPHSIEELGHVVQSVAPDGADYIITFQKR